MNSKNLMVSTLVVAVMIVSVSVLFSQQYAESENNFKVYKEKFNDVNWNTEITTILLREGELGNDWALLWSDATKEFVQDQSPIIIKKTIAGNEILSTSYNYAHAKDGTYQVLIWKGELVSDWVPKEAVDTIFFQTDAKIEKILENESLNSNCVVAYYDFYENDSEVKNDLLFSECAKDDFRIRVNLIEGEYSQEAINNVIFFSNSIVGKI